MKKHVIFFLSILMSVLLVGLPLEGGYWDKKDDNSKMMNDHGGKANGKENIVVVASDASSLSTLVTALKAADLVEVLKGEGPFTVFAPNNAAFDKLGDQLDELLKPENKEKLRSILLFHVVPGKVKSSDITKDMEVTTASGDLLSIQLKDGKVMVDDATVVSPDIKASNGVVHIIDTVITP